MEIKSNSSPSAAPVSDQKRALITLSLVPWPKQVGVSQLGLPLPPSPDRVTNQGPQASTTEEWEERAVHHHGRQGHQYYPWQGIQHPCKDNHGDILPQGWPPPKEKGFVGVSRGICHLYLSCRLWPEGCHSTRSLVRLHLQSPSWTTRLGLQSLGPHLPCGWLALGVPFTSQVSLPSSGALSLVSPEPVQQV